ncbi:MAG: M12 family metallopeptidase [Nitrososphaeraceae archaeon]
MDKNRRICIDRFVDMPLSYSKQGMKILSSLNTDELAMLPSKRWPKRKINIKFLEGTSYQREMVQNYVLELMNYANINLNFVPMDEYADIRIAFNENLGSWSYVGVDSLSVSNQNEPTLNLGWITESEPELSKKNTIQHEMLHALGFYHEQSREYSDIRWNKEKVIEDLAGPPNRWTPEQVEHNVFRRYSADISAFSEFDPNSIMIYPIPAEWTLDGRSFGFEKNGLTEIDKSFFRNMYP